MHEERSPVLATAPKCDGILRARGGRARGAFNKGTGRRLR